MDFSLIWSGSSATTFERVGVCLFIGIAIASFMIVFDRTYIGALVRRLLKKKASTPESALTLNQCGYKRNPFIRLALRREDSTLRKVVHCTSDKKVLKSEDFATAKFYIPEDKAFNAGERFSARNNTVIVAIIVCVCMFFVIGAVIKYYPWFVDKFNNIF